MRDSNFTAQSTRDDAIRAEVRAAMARNPLCEQLTAKTVRTLEDLEVDRLLRAELAPRPGPVAWYYNPVCLALGVIATLGLALRCVDIGTRDLWTDEAAKIAYARLPLAVLMKILVGGYEENPPFYFLLLGSAIRIFGDSLASYRLISLLSGVATSIAAYCLGTELYGRKIGLLAAMLVAISPYFIWYSQDASPYSLLGLLCTLSLWLFLVAIRTQRLATWMMYSTVTVIAIYVHYYAALMVALQGLYICAVYIPIHKRVPRYSLLGAGIMLALYLPHVPLAVTQIGAARQAGYVGDLYQDIARQ